MILKCLKQHGEVSVADISAAIRLSFRSTSRHLAILRLAEILDTDQRRLQVYYRITSQLPDVVRAILKFI